LPLAFPLSQQGFGLLIAGPEHPTLDWLSDSSLDHLQAASVSYRIAIRPHARRKALTFYSDSRLSGTLDKSGQVRQPDPLVPKLPPLSGQFLLRDVRVRLRLRVRSVAPA
jgi:hypothetical protein